MTANRTIAEDLRATLVGQMTRGGFLSDPAWRDAFATVPREVFVPYFSLPCQGRPGWRLAETDEEWRRGVYADEALVTQLNGDDDAALAARRGQTVEGRPTSSSSAPGLMAAMLHSLDVAEGMTVLEVGTGSGYNAALLAARLGDDAVTSIELDPALTQRARIALATAGHHPTVVTGDGAAGYPPNARYDRVIATVAFPRVPAAHLEQTHTGALILIPLSFAGRGGLMALLRRDETGGASGAFLAQYGGFMAVRSVSEPAAPKIRPRLLDTAHPTEVPPAALTDAHPAAFYLSLCCPSRKVSRVSEHPDTVPSARVGGASLWGVDSDSPDPVAAVWRLSTADWHWHLPPPAADPREELIARCGAPSGATRCVALTRWTSHGAPSAPTRPIRRTEGLPARDRPTPPGVPRAGVGPQHPR